MIWILWKARVVDFPSPMSNETLILFILVTTPTEDLYLPVVSSLTRSPTDIFVPDRSRGAFRSLARSRGALRSWTRLLDALELTDATRSILRNSRGLPRVASGFPACDLLRSVLPIRSFISSTVVSAALRSSFSRFVSLSISSMFTFRAPSDIG